MQNRTIWQTRHDGLTHWATVTSDEGSGHEIRSDCGQASIACWEDDLQDLTEITCPKCRLIGGSNRTEPETDTEIQGHVQEDKTSEPSRCSPIPDLFEHADLIHVYTRAQAIADGVLIDVSSTAKEAGIRYPTALTSAVWHNFVNVPEGVIGQDEQGRLWDIVWLLRHAARSSEGNTILFDLHVRNDNDRTERHQLKAICGPDDARKPCITVLMPNED